MAQKFIVKHRRGTLEEWRESGVKPLEGELVIEIDNENYLHKLKIGDGIHDYDDLAYLKAGDETISQVLPRVVTVTLDIQEWEEVTDIGDSNIGCYRQDINIDGAGGCCRLDLQPDVGMLAEFKQLGIIFTTENRNGVITVYSVGIKPLKTYTMQATLIETELIVESDCVLGVPVGASAMQSDWRQTDAMQLDYIKNKPTIGVGLTVENNELNLDGETVFVWDCGTSTETI